MADIYLTLEQLKGIFWKATMSALGYNPDDYKNDPDNPDYDLKMPVRKSWPTNGMPAWEVTDDIACLRVEIQDSPIDKQIDTTYKNQNGDNAIQVTSQTRVLKISWIFYGPSSFDNSSKFRIKIKQTTFHDTLAANNIYILPNDVPVPIHAPELYVGQWWDRYDLQAFFNEEIKLETTIPYIKTINLKIQKEDGETRNVNIT